MTHHLTPLGTLNRHYWLAVTMAKASGADLVQAYADGRLSAEEWADVVHRCRGCDWVQQCECWLGKSEWGAQTVPSACMNAEVFEWIKLPPAAAKTGP